MRRSVRSFQRASSAGGSPRCSSRGDERYEPGTNNTGGLASLGVLADAVRHVVEAARHLEQREAQQREAHGDLRLVAVALEVGRVVRAVEVEVLDVGRPVLGPMYSALI